jgi:hydrogenase maturation protein HypF
MFTSGVSLQPISMIETRHISVNGVVQGVGFRPFVYGLATRLELAGWVCNTSAGVEILVTGQAARLQEFVTALSAEKPPLARIDGLQVETAEPAASPGFEIRASESIQGAFQPIPPDIALCADCERELFDPNDRRYLYAFTNCTNCGPRFTIVRDLPYDRPQTTMERFELCPACAAEYGNPLDRRFHAQPVACPRCGPRLWLMRKGRVALTLDRAGILEARRLLRMGQIVAVKGLGGFHLACDAANPDAVDELRFRKGRVDKPFAVMAADLRTVESLCELDDAERALLSGREKPIVLVRKRKYAPLAASVAPGLDSVGVMLPYTPLHHLLLDQRDPYLSHEPAPTVLVMTSGNFSEEPIATQNEDAMTRLAPLADAFLVHERDIHVRCDDSVVRVDDGPSTTDHGPSSIVHLRRSRGYAPYPVNLPFDVQPTLAVGGDLKNTFCLTRGRYAFLSHHIGDMENVETERSFEQGLDHLSRLFRVQPELVACDLHPNYFSTQFALNMPQKKIGVQHHHAHIAACMADNGLENRKVIGLAFDGTGYGTDGAIWGGEVLIADYTGFERAAHLEVLPLPGGDAAVRNPWRIAAGYAQALGLDIAGLPFLAQIDPQAVRVLHAQVEKRLNTVDTSSMGRLFDAVAALAGVRNEVTYEAQAAIELEVLSRPHLARAEPYPFALEESGGRILLGVRDLLSAVIEARRRGDGTGLIGACFHRSVANMSIDVCRRIRAGTDLNEVALSGGVWQNEILMNLTNAGLQAEGFTVHVHRQTPANDGGLSLGQAVIANHQK